MPAYHLRIYTRCSAAPAMAEADPGDGEPLVLTADERTGTGPAVAAEARRFPLPVSVPISGRAPMRGVPLQSGSRSRPWVARGPAQYLTRRRRSADDREYTGLRKPLLHAWPGRRPIAPYLPLAAASEVWGAAPLPVLPTYTAIVRSRHGTVRDSARLNRRGRRWHLSLAAWAKDGLGSRRRSTQPSLPFCRPR